MSWSLKARSTLAAGTSTLRPSEITSETFSGSGGAYVCITPNRLYGPSDISAYFDDEARGFHLREYTMKDVRRMFRAAGFPRMHAYVGARGWFLRAPCFLVEALETALGLLPARARRRLADTAVLRALLGLRVVAIKG